MSKWCLGVVLGLAAPMSWPVPSLAQGYAPECMKSVETLCGSTAVGACFEDQSKWEAAGSRCAGDIQTMIENEREAGTGGRPALEEEASLGLGYSYGGILREGPGTEFARIASLADGDQIELLENTGVAFDGYDWFRVRSGENTGFYWGGIFCVDAQEALGGAFATCEASEVPLTLFSCKTGNRIVSVSALGDRLTYRYGTPEKEETSLSGDAVTGNVHFMAQRFAGPETQLRFSEGDYSYIVYSSEGNVSTDIASMSGLVVMKGTTVIADKTCSQQEDFTPAFDYQSLPKDSEAYSAM